MKKDTFYLIPILCLCMLTVLFACNDDEDTSNKEYDGTLYGEWIEDSDNRYVFDYYCFYSDGTGIHGSYESNIDWINEDDEIRWHTRNREYLYIDGAKYEYSCDGSTLEIKMKGKTKRYYEK